MASWVALFQREVDDLRHEAERLRNKRDNYQQELQETFQSAQKKLDQCQREAKQRFIETAMLNNSRHVFTLEYLYEERDRQEMMCQEDFENAIQQAIASH